MKPNHYEIIIIGAGFSGLAACTRLLALGHQPLILEARDRVGGRILNDRSLGAPVSLGAGWIHGHIENPITRIADQIGAEYVSVNLGKFEHFNRDGKLLTSEVCGRFEEKYLDMMRQVKSLAYAAENDMVLASAISQVAPSQHFTSDEQDLVADRYCYYQGYMGADAKYLSARNWDIEKIWPGENCFIKSGYDTLIHYLAKQCDIQLNSIVKSISLQDGLVAITTEHERFTANKVLITLPLGVLKANLVTFDPVLPALKQAAINQIGMGLLNVTSLKFPQTFWPSECVGFYLSNIQALSIPVYFNLQRFQQYPILMGYHGGDRSKLIEKLTNAELQDQIMHDLKNLFGNQIPKPSALITTRWSQDPFSYGAYSYPAVGVTESDYDKLAEPVAESLFFAGEATHAQHMATTHGAYLSGIREAERIHRLL